MRHVGPYTFTERDAERTFALVPALFDLLGPDEAQAAIVAPFRARAEAAVARRDRDPDAETDAALAEAWEAWRSAMGALRSAGAFGDEATGEVVGLFRSGGGVPKQPVERVDIGWRGVEGDRQADRDNHGRPFQAVCLWSAEVIEAFAAEGHPLAPGRAGENVTVRGLPWARVRPGVQLQVGPARLEVSAYATPCKKNAAWFLDGRFGLMHERHGPVSRVYATVLEPGAVAVGDAVTLEPTSGGT